MAVNDIFAMSMVYDVVGGSGEFVNVLHFRQTAYDGLSSQSAIGISFSGLVDLIAQAHYLPTLSTSITLDRIDWFIVNSPLVGGSSASGVAGAIATELLPLRSAPVVKKITELRGRSYRGRIFLMPELESNCAGGVLTPARIGFLQPYVDALLSISDGAGNTLQSTVYSPTLSTPPTSYLDNIVQSHQIQAVMGSIRGRQEVN